MLSFVGGTPAMATRSRIDDEIHPAIMRGAPRGTSDLVAHDSGKPDPVRSEPRGHPVQPLCRTGRNFSVTDADEKLKRWLGQNLTDRVRRGQHQDSQVLHVEQVTLAAGDHDDVMGCRHRENTRQAPVTILKVGYPRPRRRRGDFQNDALGVRGLALPMKLMDLAVAGQAGKLGDAVHTWTGAG